jgi:hypothetical protein
MAEDYKILDDGTIVRGDYFFNQVRGKEVQILPFKRKAWVIYILSLFTFGIYGLVMAFAMAKETNISCAEDGKHTRGFWEVIGLSIITLGIYAIVWYVQWLNRESSFLKKHGVNKTFSGSSYLGLVFIQFFVNITGSVAPALGLLCSIVNIVLAITILTKIVAQHNTVNTHYNELNNFIKKI